jgi:hypothetical protein
VAKLNGVALGTMLAGGVFLYAGIKGYSIPQTVQAVITGKKPAGQAQVTSIQTPVTPSAGSGSSPVKDLPVASIDGDYSHGKLMTLWVLAGGSPSSANNAACHAIQESSGSPTVTSGNPDGGTNVGLWQLDTKGVGAGHSVAQLQNPLTNARITVKATGNGANWSEWATPGC